MLLDRTLPREYNFAILDLTAVGLYRLESEARFAPAAADVPSGEGGGGGPGDGGQRPRDVFGTLVFGGRG
jgi:hypothetical protein